MLDVIGYSTAPEDIEVARSRLENALDFLLTAPSWAVFGCALVATMWLMWVSWPRQTIFAETTVAPKEDRLGKKEDRAGREQEQRERRGAAARQLDDLFAEGVRDAYSITTRRKFKCAGCYHQFSVTSGTIFASRKMSFTDLLAAICIFVNASKGLSALQMSRDLGCQHKTAFVQTSDLELFKPTSHAPAARKLG